MEQYTSLRNEVELVHLLYHRNKNQHRKAQFWKYLSILHRKSQHLLNALERGQDVQVLARFLYFEVIPPAYQSFQQILAQGQFIPLGFALIASCAKLRAQIGELLTRSGKRSVGNWKIDDKKQSGLESEDLGELINRHDLVEPKNSSKSEESEASANPETSKIKSLKVKKESGNIKRKPKENIQDESIRPKKNKKKTKNAIDQIFGF